MIYNHYDALMKNRNKEKDLYKKLRSLLKSSSIHAREAGIGYEKIEEGVLQARRIENDKISTRRKIM